MRARIALYIALPSFLVFAAAACSGGDASVTATDDAGPDAEAADSAKPDAALPDAGNPDDAEPPDAGTPDADNAGDAGDADATPPGPVCTVDNGGCDVNAACAELAKNVVTCTCRLGFIGDGKACADINECLIANGGCDVNATCTNTVGSKTCACNPGYTASGAACALSALTIAVDTNLSTTSTDGRVCADGGDMVAYSLVNLTATTATLSAAAGAGCLVPGDDVLVVNLQGTSSASSNTGNYELLSVKTVAADTVTFSTAKTKFFGGGVADDTNIGTATTNQRVILQRVPHYGNVTVNAGTILTANAWDGTKGGVFAFSASGAVTVEGTLTMSSLGYTGGHLVDVELTTGQQGESYAGPGALMTRSAVAGGGGGGYGDTACDAFGVPGGGGGYGAAGGAPTYVTCGGVGGAAYGDDALARLFFGSGGGSGGTDNTLKDNPHGGAGGSGGGIIYINAAGAVTGAGTIASRGGAGEGDAAGVDCWSASTTECWDFSGAGGGGAGGSILINGASFTATADVAGGTGGSGWSGAAGIAGAGAVGRAKTP